MRRIFDLRREKNLIFLIFLKNINIENNHLYSGTDMTRKTGNARSIPSGEMCGCTPRSGCSVEAVLSIDERGQMVLPKDVREKAGIKTGDKLALISWSRDGDVCCLALMKVENLSGMVTDILGPLMQEPEKN